MYKVKERREAKGWSQEKLAAESGVSRAIVSALENDDTIPTTTNRQKTKQRQRWHLYQLMICDRSLLNN